MSNKVNLLKNITVKVITRVLAFIAAILTYIILLCLIIAGGNQRFISFFVMFTGFAIVAGAILWFAGLELVEKTNNYTKRDGVI